MVALYCLVLLVTVELLLVQGLQLLNKAYIARRSLTMASKLIVGLNKYSHDASCAIINADSGQLLFAQAKERITGRKHDGGAVGMRLHHTCNII